MITSYQFENKVLDKLNNGISSIQIFCHMFYILVGFFECIVNIKEGFCNYDKSHNIGFGAMSWKRSYYRHICIFVKNN